MNASDWFPILECSLPQVPDISKSETEKSPIKANGLCKDIIELGR